MRNSGTSSFFDSIKIMWASMRYDFWLDLSSVPRRKRKALRAELRANLADASSDIGLRAALSNLGNLRSLAAAATRDGQLRSHWLAGWIAGLTTLAGLIAAFIFLTLYYSERVLDAGATEPVASSLFPYLWSKVTVDPAGGGVAWTVEPGPTPLIAAVGVWLVVAKPWRSIGIRRSPAMARRQ